MAVPTATGVRREKANYPVVLVAQDSYVDRSVVQVVSVNRAARSWLTTGTYSEGSMNGNESVRVSVGEEGEEVAAPVR